MKMFSLNATCIACLFLSALAVGGCTERVNRENVFANTETGIGIQLAQNVKTQVYELKLGYVRHELFWVPTSKLVVYKQGENGKLIEVPNASKTSATTTPTPEVVAEIIANAEIPNPASPGGTLDVGLRQRLAVGSIAVQSSAASLMMADTASAKAAIAKATVPITAISVQAKQAYETAQSNGQLKPKFDAAISKLWDQLSSTEKTDLATATNLGGTYDKAIHEEIRRMIVGQ